MAISRVKEEFRWIVPATFLINVIVLFTSAIPLMNDPDIPWHLAAGQWIWQNGKVPITDPWAFTSQGQTPWYLLSWLWDLLLYGIERLSGQFGVYLFGITLSAGLVAFLAHRLLALGVDIPPLLLILMLASLSMLEFATARPHLAGYMLVMVFHAILHHNRNSGKYGKLLCLPPLMLLWVNTHGSFIAGFTVLGAFVAEAFAKKDHAWLKRLLLVSAACACCLPINPYGFDIITGALRTLGGEAIRYTKEWQPFSLSASIGVSAWMLIFLAAGNFRAQGISLADKILALAWLFATFQAVRNGAIWILVSAPYVAASLDQQTRDMREQRPESPALAFMKAQKIRFVWFAGSAAYLAFACIAYALPHQSRLLDKEHSIKDAIEYAQANYPRQHYLTDFNYGGQVIYFTGASLPMFMDSRAGTAYTEDMMLDYIAFMLLKDGWEDKLRAYGVDAIIAGKDMLFVEAYEKGEYRESWQLVFAGQTANVYIAAPKALKHQ